MEPGSRLLESPESASPLITRAVAAALEGKFHPTYRLETWERAALRILGAFPQSFGRTILPRFVAANALHPSILNDFTLDRLLNERLSDYENLQGTFPVITVGTGLGGATAHLALTLGGPYLPQAFVMTLRGGSITADAREYMNRSISQAKFITASNPGILTIQHFDPVHDGWFTCRTNQLRIKLTSLPELYKKFILQKLQPGGTICYLDCKASWLRYRLGTMNYFQIGGWGGVTAEEYITGSPRLEDYCLREGFVQCGWKLDDYPMESGPESEWGNEPGLAEELEHFCISRGFQFIRISLPVPHDFSRLAFLAVQTLINEAGNQPAGVLIEMFSQFDASTVMKAGLLPVWLVYNTPDSLDFLRGVRPYFPAEGPVFFAPLATFSLTPDIVPWREWETALDGLDWRNIGTRPSHYPADTRAISDWAIPLRKWAQENPRPILDLLPAGKLQSLADQV